MRIVYFGNNRLGRDVLRWLVGRGEEIVAVVVHPEGRARYREEIIAAAGLPPDRVFEGPALREPATHASLAALHPHLGLSVLFGYVLPPPILDLFPRGCVNLHPAYLPYNRGAYPNVWSIVEGTPAGVTLHYMDAGVDTGDIIAQRRVCVEPVDTGETLYHKLERASLELFKATWPALRDGTAPRMPQDPSAGTYHRTRDVDGIDHIDLDRRYRARDLIDILRARTFPPYPGAYFEERGRRVYLRLTLEYGEPHDSIAPPAGDARSGDQP